MKRFGPGEEVDLDLINASLDDVAEAAFVLDTMDPVLAFRVFDAVLAEDPDHLSALVGKGRRLGANSDIFSESPHLAAQGLELLDKAVELEPEAADVRLYRALARQVQQDPEGARADLDLIDRSGLSEDQVNLYDRIAAG